MSNNSPKELISPTLAQRPSDGYKKGLLRSVKFILNWKVVPLVKASPRIR